MGAAAFGSVEDGKELFLKSLEKKFTYAAAARDMGIDVRTVYAWRNEDPVFREACEQIREGCIDMIETKVYEDALEKGGLPAFVILNGHRSQVYKGNRVDHSGNVKIEVVWEKLPQPDELPEGKAPSPLLGSGEDED